MSGTRGSFTPVVTPELIKAFEARYIPEPNSGCWLWLSHVNNNGYGRIHVEGRNRLAHRISWAIVNGPIPVADKKDFHGTCVLHKCDVPSCVNPDHLFLGTHKDNMSDVSVKNRWNPLHGEDSVWAKLTDVEVTVIRKLASVGHTQRRLGSYFGINKATVSRIVSGEKWAHVK